MVCGWPQTPVGVQRLEKWPRYFVPQSIQKVFYLAFWPLATIITFLQEFNPPVWLDFDNEACTAELLLNSWSILTPSPQMARQAIAHASYLGLASLYYGSKFPDPMDFHPNMVSCTLFNSLFCDFETRCTVV
jgi:hypothetical protein